MSDRFDTAIIGGGIVGLATAYQLLVSDPARSVVLLEKERELATHQTGHNSGVLHSGLFDTPGSRKARLCREGKAAMEEFARAHAIPFERRGKLVVALSQEELPRLRALHERAQANGVEGVEIVGPERIREIEPHAAGIQALWSPQTAVIDFRKVALALAEEIRARGGAIRTSSEVIGIETRETETVVVTASGAITCTNVIACAGLHADRVASMTGAAGETRIVPFRGDYYTLAPEARGLVRGLIYPVPDPRFPFLGVHWTRTIDGEVLAGPNAVLAFAREGYQRTDFSFKDISETLAFAGFRRLARRHWRTGLAEMRRDWSKAAFAEELRRTVPDVNNKDIVFGPSGVRAQALARDGSLVEDFAIREGRRVLHVVNAPSPAATASLAIGRELAQIAAERFGSR